MEVAHGGGRGGESMPTLSCLLKETIEKPEETSGFSAIRIFAGSHPKNQGGKRVVFKG